MLPAERSQKILKYINKNQSANVKELVKLFKASESTIRRDLENLANKGLITRTHGGAIMKTLGTTYEKKAQEKRIMQQKEKDYIGHLAAQYIADGESIILDSGSTCLALSKYLKDKKDITLITYDLKIALETQLGPGGTVIITGGIRRDEFDVLVGSDTENFIKRINADKAFLGADALDMEKGITNATFAEVPIKQQIIRSAKEVILIADHTKFGKTALAKVTDVNSVDLIITDPQIDKSILNKLEEKGIWVKSDEANIA